MQERNNKWMKRLDKYIGSPLLFLLGAFRGQKMFPHFSDNPNIIILKTAAIGDTILAGSVVAELRAHFPMAVITFVCSKTNAGMARMLDDVDNVFVFEIKKPITSLREIARFPKQNLLIDLAPWARINGVISYACDADYKIGFRRDEMHRHYVYDATVEHSDHVHEIDNYRNLLQLAGVQPYGFIPKLSWRETCPRDGDYVVLHQYPGGTGKALKSWDLKNWKELAERIYAQYG